MSAAEQLVTQPFVFPCKDGDKCPHLTGVEQPARPYAYKRSGPKSVTQLLSLLDKGEGMQHAAARLTLETCWYAGAEFRTSTLDEAMDKYARVFKGVWSKRALLGNLTHDAIDAWARGETYTIPTEFRGDPVELDPRDEEQLAVFLGGAYAWTEARQPEVLASELIVSRDNPAIRGSLDRLQLVSLPEVGSVCALTDWKSTIHVDHDPYERDWELQLQLYGNCDVIEHWHGRDLVDTISWAESGLPRPTHGLLVNIQGDGSVREFVCELSEDAMRYAHALVELKSFKPSLRQVSTLNKPEPVVYAPRPQGVVDVEGWLG